MIATSNKYGLNKMKMKKKKQKSYLKKTIKKI